MRTFPSAQPQKTVSTREGWAEGEGCSDPPSLSRDQWDMGKWDWAEKHRSSTTTKSIRIFVCVYTLYGYLYKWSVHRALIQSRKSRISLHYTISECPDLSDPHEDKQTQYCPILSPSDLLIFNLKPKHMHEPFPKCLYPSDVMVGTPCCHIANS